MKTTTRFFFLSLFALSFSAALHAQSVLAKGYAFAQKANYGREMKDLEGKTVQRPDSLYVVYLELKGKAQPQITKATYNGRVFTASVVAVPETSVTVGKLQSTQKAVTVQGRKTTTLWRIELTPTQAVEKNLRPKGLVLTGKSAGKAFVYSAPRWTVLAAEIMG